jgi:hypothetical protein
VALSYEDEGDLEQAFLRSSADGSDAAHGVDPAVVHEAFSLQRALRNVPVILDTLGPAATEEPEQRSG